MSAADPRRETEQTPQTLITSPTTRQRATLQIIQRVNRKQRGCTASAAAPVWTNRSTVDLHHAADSLWLGIKEGLWRVVNGRTINAQNIKDT